MGPISGASARGRPFPREFVGFRVARNAKTPREKRPFWRGPLKTRGKSPPLGGRVGHRGQKGPKQNQNGPKSPKVVNMVPKSPKWSHKAQNGPSDSKTCLIHDYMSYWATLGTFSGPRGLYYKPKQHQNYLKWPKITQNGPALPKIIIVNLTQYSGA